MNNIDANNNNGNDADETGNGGAGNRPPHIRNDSTFSIDSHASLTNNDNKTTIVNIEGLEQIASSGAGRAPTTPSQQQQQQQHETIEGGGGSRTAALVSQASHASTSAAEQQQHQHTGSGDLASTDESAMPGPPPPVHAFPFFTEGDSDDRSDGSVAFHHQRPLSSSERPPHQQQQQQPPGGGSSSGGVSSSLPAADRQFLRSRERFPSFDDSVGSSGSVIRKTSVPRNVSNTAAANTAVQSAPPSQQKILPYHERRKLKKKQQQQQQSREPTPPRPGRQPPPPFFVPQHHQQQQPRMPSQQQQPPPMYFSQPMYGGGPPTPPPYQPSPMPPSQFDGSFPGSFPPEPPPPGSFPFPPPGSSSMPPYPMPPPTQFQPPSQPQPDRRQLQQQQSSGGYRNGDRPPARGSQQQQQQQQQRPRGAGGQQPPYARPPQHQQRSAAAAVTSRNEHQVLQWQTSSSFDSSDGMEQPQQHSLPSSSSGAPPRPARRKDALLPPPPPPPPPPPTTHIRQDSAGSVSSLGSMDNSNNGGKQQEKSFFQRIWSTAPKRHDVKDFHRQNQAFLSKMERKGLQNNSPSPRTMERRVPFTAMSAPPTSRGGHRRLNSIENDDWSEPGDEEEDDDDEKDFLLSQERGEESKKQQKKSRGKHSYYGTTGESSGDSDSVSYSETSEDSERWHSRQNEAVADEHTHLLPPPGISSNEHYDRKYRDSSRRAAKSRTGGGSGVGLSGQKNVLTESTATMKIDNTSTAALTDLQGEEAARERKKRKKKKRRAREKSRRLRPDEGSDSSSLSSTSVSSREYKRWVAKRASLLEKERAKLIEQWKAEAKAETEKAIMLERRNRWYRRLWRCFQSSWGPFALKVFNGYMYCEEFIANLPLTIGAIALSTANLGVDWFKFAEENMDSCEPVHFHSQQCTFPEFPGCFYCDTTKTAYKIAVNFHFVCSCIAGLLAFSVLSKLIVARRVVFDELSSPTTASPAGLLCMTMNVVFAGRGTLGMVVVSAAASVHFCLAIWFMYMALAYHIMPEPSWFPNTTGLGISAVKLWLYYPMAGHFLMAISLALNFFFFPISLVRVFLNRKISATVSWMQQSAPNISLYALTIMAQPSFEEEHPDINNFQKVHRMVYLPCMHFLFFLCILGMMASVYGLVIRWPEFSKIPFSPAHAAFCAPCLSHANAIQAYRASVNSFSDLPSRSPFLLCLYVYWLLFLVGGTCVTVCIAVKYLASLSKWTHFDLSGETEPPQPYETAMSLTHMVSTGEKMVQPFVSPAVLQSNETGTLYLTRDAAGARKYRRTRKMTAVGFEPMMDAIELEQERELLLDWVGKNAPRRRNRTLSVPGVDFNYAFGTGHRGVYGMEEGNGASRSGRRRSNTLSPQVVGRRMSDNA